MTGDTGPALPQNLARTPRLDRWIAFEDDGAVVARTGKVELGQGILTALAQIVAEELDVPLARVRVEAATTDAPDEAVTAGSLSVQDSGGALRTVCAQVRARCLDEASRRWSVSRDALLVQAGSVEAPDGRRASYASLVDGGLLACDARTDFPPKRADAHTVVGTSVPRVDLPDKLYGRPRFIHDLVFDGMLHGRVAHPPRDSAVPQGLDLDGARACEGVHTALQDGRLAAVIAATSAQADRAYAALVAHARWIGGATLPDLHEPNVLQARACESRVVARRDGGAAPATRTVRARYTRPFIAHASIGPSCAIARWDAGALQVWTHSQGIHNLRRDLALAFRVDIERVRVAHVEGAGCYGHNGADDVAFDAAWLAHACAGRPVRVMWRRADELGLAPLGPATVIEVEADVTDDARVRAWRHAIWSPGHSGRPGRNPQPALLGASETADPFVRPVSIDLPPSAGGGAERNAVPEYAIPSLDIVCHRVLDVPVRTSSLRALGAHMNVFAIESHLDAVARACGADPVALRLAHLDDPRGRRVIERAVARAAVRPIARDEGWGRGLAYARYKGTGAYCAVVADIEAQAEIRVRRLTICVDVGRAINPDGVENQIEGGAVQAASWTLKEAVTFDAERVTSDAWERYPILRFSDIPAVDVEIVDSEAPSLGAGEASIGPTSAAIANAVFDALGVRVRDLPITAERVVAAMEADDATFS